jgi:hypothetical protein
VKETRTVAAEFRVYEAESAVVVIAFAAYLADSAMRRCSSNHFTIADL